MFYGFIYVTHRIKTIICLDNKHNERDMDHKNSTTFFQAFIVPHLRAFFDSSFLNDQTCIVTVIVIDTLISNRRPSLLLHRSSIKWNLN